MFDLSIEKQYIDVLQSRLTSFDCICRQLTARPDRVLAMHSELRDTHLYLEFIAFGFLVCPSLLFHPDAKFMEIFRLSATDQLVVTLYRELVRYHSVSMSIVAFILLNISFVEYKPPCRV